MKGKTITGPIPEAVVTDTVDGINGLLTGLGPYEMPITTDEKKRLPKAADGSQAFIEKSKDYSLTDTDYLPGYVDAAEFANDVARSKQADEMEIGVRKLLAVINNISILSKSDAYVVSLEYYNNCRRAAKNGDARAQVIADELGKLFSRTNTNFEPQPNT